MHDHAQSIIRRHIEDARQAAKLDADDPVRAEGHHIYAVLLELIADEIAAALDSRAGDAGEGWKLVPVEPTKAMTDAAFTAWMTDSEQSEMCAAIYTAMLSATPAPAVDDVDIDSPAARLDMVRVALTGIIDNPASAVPLARAGLDFCDLTEAQRKEMRGDA